MSEGPHSEGPGSEVIMYVSPCFHLFKIRFVSIKACEALACPEIPDIFFMSLFWRPSKRRVSKLGSPSMLTLQAQTEG